MLQKETPVKELRSIGEAIDHELAANMVREFQETYPNEGVGNYIGRDVLDSILAQPGCVGIRFYNAINENGVKTLVYIGVDAEDKLMTKSTVVNDKGEMETRKGLVCDRSGVPDRLSFDWLWTWITDSL